MAYLFPLTNTVQNYDWGSAEAISELTGLPNPQGKPMAELWMGAHPKAPSRAALPQGSVPLDALIAADAERHLGRAAYFGALPYLLKLLAAAKPLSIQAHPNLEQAREGWERENRAGLAPDAPNRNYRDANHKPEILCALTAFRAMCGFRAPRNIIPLLDALGMAELEPCRRSLDAASEEEALKGFLLELFAIPADGRIGLTERIGRRARELADENSAHRREWTMAADFARLYPGDPSIIAPLYLNVLDLKPGEAVYLPAGILHAYVEGFGVELMANSDNVLRGGLTPKHVDLDELVRVLRFEAHSPSVLGADAPATGAYVYETPAAEFALARFARPREPQVLSQGIPRIVVVTEGTALVRDGAGGSLVLERGRSAFISAAAPRPSLEGDFSAYAAGTGRLHP